MQNRLLSTMLKLALDTNAIKPEEVMAILQSKNKNTGEDKNTETVDGDVIDAKNPSNDDVNNQEGKILETTFKELEVEDAIEEAKEMKQLNQPITSEGTFGGNNNMTIHKAANMWEALGIKVKTASPLPRFKVDSSCIDCDLCREIAPANFKRDDDEGVAVVHKQPTSILELAKCKKAKAMCPVYAIKTI